MSELIVQLFKIPFVDKKRCVCVCACMFSSVAAHKQLTTQKQKPNHDETSLQDYSDLQKS